MGGIGEFGGKSLDLVVTVVPGETYRKNTVRENNGLNCGNLDQGNHGTGHIMCTEGAHFGQINLGTGFSNNKGEKVKLKFEFQASRQPIALPGLYFSYFDLDQNKG